MGLRQTASRSRKGFCFPLTSLLTLSLIFTIATFPVLSPTTLSNVWVSVGSFTAGKISLANLADQYQSLTSVLGRSDSTPGSATTFFVMKASGVSTAAQTHIVPVYDKRPDIASKTELLTYSATFSSVKETIKASANKVTSITSALLPTSATLALRLDSTRLTLECNKPHANIVLRDILYYSPPTIKCYASNGNPWTGVYVFRIIGPSPSALAP